MQLAEQQVVPWLAVNISGLKSKKKINGGSASTVTTDEG